MVKNSRSFELTKIRHYLDKPYRGYFERAKGSPPVLPRLHAWQDESLRGAINPAQEQQANQNNVMPPAASQPKKSPGRRPNKKSTVPATSAKSPDLPDAPFPLARRNAATRSSTPKTLSLGEAPSPPAGENCNVRDILVAAAHEQNQEFAAMTKTLGVDFAEMDRVQRARSLLVDLHESFGEEDKSSAGGR